MVFSFNTLRFKITLLSVIFLGLILILYSSILYYTLRFTLYNDLDQELIVKAEELGNSLQTYWREKKGTPKSFQKIANKVLLFDEEQLSPTDSGQTEKKLFLIADKYDLREDHIHISKKGVTVARSNNFSPGLLSHFRKHELEAASEVVFKTVTVDNKKLRVLYKPYRFFGDEDHLIEIGTSLKPIINLLDKRLASIIFSIPVILLLTSFIGHFLTLRILKPVLAVTKTAEKITHEDLSARVKTKHADDEMKYLVNAFNGMIDRLEKSFRYIAEFSSQVAHELKTPLAILRGESQMVLKAKRKPEEYERVIRVNLEEIERMIRVVEDLLLATKLEYDTEVFKFELFDLAEFMQDIYEQSKILASQKEMEVTMPALAKRVFIHGDRLHLRRLFFNLVDNAIKFSPQKSTIHIGVHVTPNQAEISVTDQGIGIHPADQPHIFKKFFHKDPRKNASYTGTGLGLSLALAIANAHRGTIAVKSEVERGSTFTVTLPRAAR